MTPRFKKLLITAVALSAVLTVLNHVILPHYSIACVYQSPSGEPVKAWGRECYQREGAIVLRAE